MQIVEICGRAAAAEAMAVETELPRKVSSVRAPEEDVTKSANNRNLEQIFATHLGAQMAYG